MNVFLLWHSRELANGCDDVKLIGAYANRNDAIAAQFRAGNLPGFRDCREGFTVDMYEVGKDHWSDGFVTLSNAE